MNDYWTQLFTSFEAMMDMFGDEQGKAELQARIKALEDWLSDEYNPLTLQEIETRMFQNMDLLSGFAVNGEMITQMEINEKLSEIKVWLTRKLYQYLPNIRFTQQIRME